MFVAFSCQACRSRMIACQPPVPGEKEMAIFNTIESLHSCKHAILYCGSALTGIRLGCSPGAEILFLFSSAYSQRDLNKKFPAGSRYLGLRNSPLKRGRINIGDIWLPNPSVLACFLLTWYIQIMMSSLIQNTQSSASQSPTKLYNLQVMANCNSSATG